MEIVIVEKRTFEALLTAAGTLAAKVDALHRRCGDRQGCKWLDGEDVCRILRILPPNHPFRFHNFYKKPFIQSPSLVYLYISIYMVYFFI